MTDDMIYRVRRLALAARIVAGGWPTAAEWRRAALEPFDDYAPPFVLSSGEHPAPIAVEPTTPKRLPGPSF